MATPPDHDHLDLEGDGPTARAFVVAENARSADALRDARHDADVALIRGLLEDPAVLPSVTRRGRWLFTFRRTAEHPKGRWLRLPDGEAPEAGADWETVFDVGAFCDETGRDWAWRGAVTAAFDPMRVLLTLALDGSDLWRFVEFDCEARRIIEGGFDIGPQKGSCAWLDVDTLLVGSAAGGDATDAGRPRVIRQLARGASLAEAPVIFEVEQTDLLARAWVWRAGTDAPVVHLRRAMEIDRVVLTVRWADERERLLPTPADTSPVADDTHYAWVARSEGDHPPGTLLVASLEDGPPRTAFTPGPRRVVEEWSVHLFRGRLLWTVQDELRPELWTLDLEDPVAEPRRLDLVTGAETVDLTLLDAVSERSDGTMLLRTQGLSTPSRVTRFGLGDDPRAAVPFLSVPPAFDAGKVAVEMLEAVSEDGTRIPYRLMRPAGARSNLPVVLYGYGGFRNALVPYYRRLWGAAWVARGGAYAMAHIRGGSEFGPKWHEAARREGRPRAFEDFAAVASDIATRGIAPPERIAAHGGSNGGLLAGVMLTRYPERFGAIWATVPLLDMLRFARFPAGKAWRDEYGDPEEPEDAAFLRAYSPFHQVGEGPYPPVLLTTHAHDDRVDPSHARRMAARLGAFGHEVLFHESNAGGHGGGGATDQQARDFALGLSFLRRTIGVGMPEGQGRPISL